MQSKLTIENINAYSVKNKKYEFVDSLSYFIVLKNNHYCSNCFLSINDYVAKIKNDFPVNCLAIVSCDSNSLDRKRNYAETKNLLTSFDDIIFQYTSSIENLFKKNSIYNTPEIVILSKGKLTMIPYNEIFDFYSMNILPATQLKITELLNGK